MALYYATMPVQVWKNIQRGSHEYQTIGLQAHDVLDNKKTVEDLMGWYNSRPTKVVDGSIITKPVIFLDNSSFELGAPVPIADLIEAARIVQPRWVVPPDRIGSWEATKGLFLNFWVQWCDIEWPHTSIMLPIQFDHTNEGELLECIRYWSEWRAATDDVRVYAVPKYYDQKSDSPTWKTRRDIVWELLEYHGCMQAIHYLGLSNDYMMQNFIDMRAFRSIISIDSTLPVRMGLDHISITDHKPTDTPFTRIKTMTSYMSHGTYRSRGAGEEDPFWKESSANMYAYENIFAMSAMARGLDL